MRQLLIGIGIACASVLAASGVWAGSPHFVGKFVIEVLGNTLIVSGKEAGLGNETQVHIEAFAEAQCVNPGGKEPKADNKDEFGAAGDFPVQNGKALFTLQLIAVLQPDCTPPMTLEWSNLEVCDTEHNVCAFFPGPLVAE